jgi:predicted O-methyltransferase YrrM
MPTIQIDDNAGHALQLLTMLRAPSHVIELGTLFGYSAVYLARGLPPHGRLTTVERDPVRAELARKNIQKAGVGDRVEIVIGDATWYLTRVLPQSVGMIFIDANKEAYVHYLKLCLPLLEPRGLLVADDAFAEGDFQQDSTNTPPGSGTKAIQDYVWAVCKSKRLLSFFLGSENGLLVTMRI